jgi:hypothetical protein
MLLLSGSAAPCKIRGSASQGNLLPLAAPLLQTSLRDRPPDQQGKVRDLYDFGDRLLIVATDRISAFDYVLGSGIPDKGKGGYLSGSAWKDYIATGQTYGIPLPAGLRESEQLPEPIFTPATKAQSGHDINITRRYHPCSMMWSPRRGKNTSRRFIVSRGANCYDF